MKGFIGGERGAQGSLEVYHCKNFLEHLRAAPSAGNAIRMYNWRKMWCIYVTVAQWPRECRAMSDCWFPLAVLRTSASHGVEGGISGAVGKLIHHLFVERKIHDEGVTVKVGANTLRLHFEIKAFYMDGDAWRAVFSAKGAGGKLLCFRCVNVVNALYHDPASDLVCHHSINEDDWNLATDADIWQKADMLRDAVGRPRFADMETGLGLTYKKDGLLWQDDIRQFIPPITVFRFDFMHVYLQGGICNHELDLLFHRLEEAGYTFGQMREYVTAKWGHPGWIKTDFGHSTMLNRSVEKHWREGDGLKMSASSLMCLQVVLVHALLTKIAPGGDLARETECFDALQEVLSLYIRAKRKGACGGQLRTAIRRHSRLHKAVYGVARWSPKHHWGIHLPDQVEADGELVDCFSGERKHQWMKAAADGVAAPEDFERSVLVSALSGQIAFLRDLKDCIIQTDDEKSWAHFAGQLPRGMKQTIEMVLIAQMPLQTVFTKVRMRGQLFYRHDVMWYNDQFGVAVLFLPTGVLWQQLTYVDKVSVEAKKRNIRFRGVC